MCRLSAYLFLGAVFAHEYNDEDDDDDEHEQDDTDDGAHTRMAEAVTRLWRLVTATVDYFYKHQQYCQLRSKMIQIKNTQTSIL